MFCNILQKYVQKMQKLRRGEKGNEGPAPHKPLLLLAVIDLIRQGQIDENRIFPFPDLAETFLKYWSNVVANRASNFAMPFFHLKGDKFWHLCPNPGKEDKLNRHRKVNSISWIHEVVAYASLDEELFVLLTNSQDREVICQTLINKYFPNSKQEIESLIAEEQQIGEYRQLLIQEVAEHTVLYEEQTEPIEKENPNRSEAFRREIMRIYNYTCVVCRSRILTMEGESATEAAHIIPFRDTKDDNIRNGISLCKLHHWAFDEGLISFSKTYKIMVSELIFEEGPTEWMLTELRDKSILLPEHNLLSPSQDALRWHRERIFRKEA